MRRDIWPFSAIDEHDKCGWTFSYLASLTKSGYYREGQTSSPCPLTTVIFDSVPDNLTGE